MLDATLGNPYFVLVLLLLWPIPWKGVALWRAARRGELKWFIALLIINTLAILEIIYIFGFSKRPQVKPVQQ
ncbi:MAG: DUF5652 family protein [Patescibacteria group bacterium]|jgi:hypothetical protein